MLYTHLYNHCCPPIPEGGCWYAFKDEYKTILLETGLKKFLRTAQAITFVASIIGLLIGGNGIEIFNNALALTSVVGQTYWNRLLRVNNDEDSLARLAFEKSVFGFLTNYIGIYTGIIGVVLLGHSNYGNNEALYVLMYIIIVIEIGFHGVMVLVNFVNMMKAYCCGYEKDDGTVDAPVYELKAPTVQAPVDVGCVNVDMNVDVDDTQSSDQVAARPIKAGWVRVMSGMFGSYDKRWVVVKDGKLNVFGVPAENADMGFDLRDSLNLCGGKVKVIGDAIAIKAGGKTANLMLHSQHDSLDSWVAVLEVQTTDV